MKMRLNVMWQMLGWYVPSIINVWTKSLRCIVMGETLQGQQIIKGHNSRKISHIPKNQAWPLFCQS